MTPQLAKGQLEASIRVLRGQIEQAKLLGGVPSDIKRIEYVATAIERYLSGEAPSLDRAFGIKRIGRPRGKPGKHLQLTIDTIPMLCRGLSWSEICDELGSKHTDALDARELRRIVGRHYDEAIQWYSAHIQAKPKSSR